MSEQLSFRLPIKVARERDAFFVSEANQQAVAQLENTACWPQGKLILLGPKACGKTHLLEIWATEQNAQKIDPLREFVPPEAGARVVVDNLEQVAGILPAETRLFHLHNQLQSQRRAVAYGLQYRHATSRVPAGGSAQSAGRHELRQNRSPG